jgi:hypothetical protein
MLDADGRIELDTPSDVIVFRDTSDPLRYYAFAATPHVATDEHDVPQFSLLAYTHTVGRLEGGQVSFTTSLGVSAEQRDAIVNALTPPDKGPHVAESPPAPVVYTPEWLSTVVHVRLVQGVECIGNGSLVGPNTCALSATLDDTQAEALRSSLLDGLPSAHATYRVELAAARRNSAAAFGSSSATTGTSTSTTSSSAAFSATSATRLALQLDGPLRIPSAHASALLTLVML